MANQWLGQLVAGTGSALSNIFGRDIRLGSGGSSLGANIAGQSQPYFSTTQNLAYSKQGINPYANVPAGYQGKSATQIATERANQQQQQQQQQQRQNNPSSQNNRQGGTITENEALARGWDINNLPAGYTRASSGDGIHTPNYDALISQVNQNADVALAGLDPQQVAQEAIAQNMYTGGVSNLQAQQAQGNAALDIARRKAQENQVSTLNDLTENLRNMFNSGQTYLGARGAGDSSAANQYSYALTQLGNKNRGNVMNQTASILNDINDRANQLQMQVTQGIKQLDTEKGTQLQGIAQWFAQAQAQIRATKGQNIVALGQQALDNAMNAINQVNANAQAQKNSLLQWAENNATTIQGLKSNMQQVFGNYNPQLPVAGNLPGLTGGAVGSSGNYYPGSNQTDQRLDIFGNRIQ